MGCDCELARQEIGYFASYSTPALLAKVRLSDMAELNRLTLNSPEDAIDSSIIDETNGFIYLANYAGNIVKVRLSDFTKIGTLATGSNDLVDAGVDVANSRAYFPVYTYSPAKVIKVNLTTFVVDSTLNLTPTNARAISCVIDTENGFLYVILDRRSSSYSSWLVKINLATFTESASIEIPLDRMFDTAIIDNTQSYLYCAGTHGLNRYIWKIRLSDFTVVDTLTIPIELVTSYYNFRGYAIDSASEYLYLGDDSDPGAVVKINLSTFAVDTRLAFAESIGTDDYARTWKVAIDHNDEYLYCGMGSSYGTVVKVDLASFSMEDIYRIDSVINDDWISEIVIARQAGIAAHSNFGTLLDGGDYKSESLRFFH
jgi:hypothetical protein